MNYFGIFPHLKFCLRMIAVGALLSLSGCSTSTTAVSACDDDSSILIGSSSCLHFEDEGQIDPFRDEIVQVTQSTFSAVNQLMPVEDVNIRVVVAPQNVIPQLGINGYNPNENEVIIHTDPSSRVFQQSIQNDLSSILAHELHHVKRRRTVGYGSTLLEAFVSEGLADHFSVEVTQGEPPIWSKVLSENQLDSLIQKARQNWNTQPYDHNKWFFGSSGEIPFWSGYSIGYELVRRYLSRHPERNASNLFDEPASSFIPE